MENIKLNEKLIGKFFSGMDNDCLEQVQHLVEQGAVLNPLSGELVLNNTRTGIFTDYFDEAFYLDEDEKPHQDQKLVIASRRNPYGDDWQYICVEESPDGSDSAMARAWDPNSEKSYGTECRVYQFRIEVDKDEWESYPIWFESRDDAAIFTTNLNRGLGDAEKQL